jgi:NADH-quinone oxidoreductase subunit C
MKSKETELCDTIKSTFHVDGNIQRERRVWVSVEKNTLSTICRWLKEHGFVHLSAISVTDWVEEKQYELTYHLWSYDDKVLVTVKTRIDRENPFIDSVTPIWKENAQIHERELHELFGVNFEGNTDLTPLFLENWTGPPPFKKDFNWREYVREEFYDKDNERERVYYD